MRVLAPDDDWVQADEGLYHSEYHEQGGENLQIRPFRLELHAPKEDGATVEAPTNAMEQEHNGERDHGQRNAIQSHFYDL